MKLIFRGYYRCEKNNFALVNNDSVNQNNKIKVYSVNFIMCSKYIKKEYLTEQLKESS